jgi:hypothetical protein
VQAFDTVRQSNEVMTKAFEAMDTETRNKIELKIKEIRGASNASELEWREVWEIDS